MRYVFNTEGDGEILGTCIGVFEDSVIYAKPGSDYHGIASLDCVTVREVPREEITKELARFARAIESTKAWVDGDTQTAMNGLVELAAEMIEYAQTMGAKVKVDDAMREVHRREKNGYRVGNRAHSEDCIAA